MYEGLGISGLIGKVVEGLEVIDTIREGNKIEKIEVLED